MKSVLRFLSVIPSEIVPCRDRTRKKERKKERKKDRTCFVFSRDFDLKFVPWLRNQPMFKISSNMSIAGGAVASFVINNSPLAIPQNATF